MAQVTHRARAEEHERRAPPRGLELVERDDAHLRLGTDAVVLRVQVAEAAGQAVEG